MNVKDFSPNPKNLVGSYETTGFQATNLARAVKIIKRMKKEKATIFLSFTANMVATGLRGIFADLCRRKFIDGVITTGGSLDHDIIRSYSDYSIGDFSMDDSLLYKKGINRLGNILIPNSRYELLEKKIQSLLKKIYNKKKIVSPSELAYEAGNSLKDKNSFLYWCSKKNIPVFSPGIVDSAVGLQIYFFKQRHSDFGIDVTADMPKLGEMVLDARKTGGIILGGGISKHYTIASNILRDGLDYAVYVTTASPWDGSLSGARTQEAVSWGKISEKAKYITVDGDATIIFPIIASAVV